MTPSFSNWEGGAQCALAPPPAVAHAGYFFNFDLIQGYRLIVVLRDSQTKHRYRQFIRSYSNLAIPMNGLQKKTHFDWGEAESHTFTKVNGALKITEVTRRDFLSMNISLNIERNRFEQKEREHYCRLYTPYPPLDILKLHAG